LLLPRQASGYKFLSHLQAKCLCYSLLLDLAKAFAHKLIASEFANLFSWQMGLIGQNGIGLRKAAHSSTQHTFIVL